MAGTAGVQLVPCEVAFAVLGQPFTPRDPMLCMHLAGGSLHSCDGLSPATGIAEPIAAVRRGKGVGLGAE